MMIDAMIALVKATGMSRAHIARLKCSDLSVGGTILEINNQKKKIIVSDYSLVYPIIGYHRNRIIEAGNPEALLFPISMNTMSRQFKKMTGCTIQEYNDTKI